MREKRRYAYNSGFSSQKKRQAWRPAEFRPPISLEKFIPQEIIELGFETVVPIGSNFGDGLASIFGLCVFILREVFLIRVLSAITSACHSSYLLSVPQVKSKENVP